MLQAYKALSGDIFWDDLKDDKYKNDLVQYNLEDCFALKLLTDKITQIEKICKYP